MTSRPATASDAGTIAALLTSFNAEFDTWSPSLPDLERRLEVMLAGASAYVVLVPAGHREADGFALVTLRPSPYYEGPIATVDEMYVRPEQRGQGLGGELMALLLRLAHDRGCGEVQINVDEDDVRARRFYERHGFTNHEPDGIERMLCYIQELKP